MSTLVLDRTEQAQRLESFIGGFKNAASEANTQVSKQKRIDRFLDFVLDRQKYLADVNAEFSEKMPGFSQFFWYTEPDEATLKRLRELVDLMHEVSATMQVVYRQANDFFYKNKLSRTAVFQYRDYSNQLKEIAVDLEHRYFAATEDDEFLDIMQQLEEV